jgi:hypothetical protein
VRPVPVRIARSVVDLAEAEDAEVEAATGVPGSRQAH